MLYRRLQVLLSAAIGSNDGSMNRILKTGPITGLQGYIG